MKQELLVLQYQASKYNSWEYYQQILELQEDIRCRQEIMVYADANCLLRYIII